MVRKVVRWTLGAANKQNEGPLRDSAERPVVANAEQVR
jgi:hypothetical protein